MISTLKKYKHKKLSLLVCNDDPFQLLIISSNLQNLRYVQKIQEASNGQEALNLVQQKPQFDMIFLDLDMPIMDGYAACKKIIEHYSPERSVKEDDFDELY